MRQFLDDELQDGHPIRDGLTRVTEKLIGPIIKREIKSYTPMSDTNRGTATVHVSLTIIPYKISHLQSFNIQTITEDGIAEVNSRNTINPFYLHACATASSKAEAQALRKVLRLRKIVSADELSPADIELEGDVFNPDTIISKEQISIIDLICRRVNISVLDFISSGEIKYVFIEQIPSSKAQKMIKYLNEIQSQKVKSPVSKSYDPQWREVNYKRANNESTN
jgi:hypothetical protein